MGTLLQILGLIFLGLIVLGLLMAAYIGWKIRSAVKTIKKQMEGIPHPFSAPPRLTLTRLDDPAWSNPTSANALAGPLPSLGFENAGTFRATGAPGLTLQAWVNPPQSVTAVVYQHAIAGTWIDYFTHFDDGTRITYANTHVGGGIDQAPGHIVERFPGLDSASLFQRFLADRPAKPMRTITAETFVPVFEQTYAEEMDWRMTQAGATQGKARAIPALTGGSFGESSGTVRARMERQAQENLEEALRHRFLEQSQISAQDWERTRDRVVIVHDLLTEDELDELIEPWSDDDAPSHFDGSAREAFAEYNESRPEGARFQKLGVVSEPIDADVYRAPEL